MLTVLASRSEESERVQSDACEQVRGDTANLVLAVVPHLGIQVAGQAARAGDFHKLETMGHRLFGLLLCTANLPLKRFHMGERGPKARHWSFSLVELGPFGPGIQRLHMFSTCATLRIMVKKAVIDTETGEFLDENEGESSESDSVTREWVPIGKACKTMGVSIRTMRRMIAHGEVETKRDGKLLLIASDGVEVTSPELGASELIAAAASLVTSAQGHVEKLVNLHIGLVNATTSATEKTLTAAATESAAMRERITKLEDKNFEMLQDAEKAASLSHERELATKAFESSEARKNAAIGMFMQYAPKLMNIVGEKWLLPSGQSHLGAFVKSLTPDQLTAFASTLTPEQLHQFSELLKMMSKDETPAKPASDATRPESTSNP